MNEQMMGREVYCNKCNQRFVVRGWRLCGAKTLSCFYCGKRIPNENKVQTKIKGGGK